MTLSSLIKRLEEAEGPSRELDVAICWALDLEPWAGTDEVLLAFFAKGSKMDKQTPALTGQVDAAISLAERVLPGWRHAHDKRCDGVCLAWVDCADDEPSFPSDAPTVALAMTLATLRAIQSKGDKP